MWMMLFLVVMSILTLSLGTVRDFRTALNACQYRDHLLDLARQTDDEKAHYYSSAIILMNNFSCNIPMAQVRKKAQRMHQYLSSTHFNGLSWYQENTSNNGNFSNFNKTKSDNGNATQTKKAGRDHHSDGGLDSENYEYYDDLYDYFRELIDAFFYDYREYYDEKIENSKILDIIAEVKSLPELTKRHDVLTFIDIALVIIFTFEMIVRLVTCPTYKRFFVDWLNILDILIMVSAYAGLVLEFRFAKFRYNEKGFRIFLYLQMLRVLRVMRCIKNVPAVLVLTHTVRTNFKDLVVLISFILIGVLIFGHFAFFVEDKSDFDNIPTSWWWGIITMTTVGYGDVVPKTVLGKIIGCLCALSGVICLSLTLPVFVNTFISLYKFSNIYEKRLRKCSAKIHPSARKYAKASLHETNSNLPVLNTRQQI